MPDRFVTDDEARALLKALCRERGSSKALAAELDVTPSYISQVVRGRAPVGAKIAPWLGLCPVRGFVRIRP